VTVLSWGQVKELLHQAIALGPESRAKFLDEVCASDAALREELESLLSVGDGMSAEFLQSPLTGKFSADGGGLGTATLAEGQLFAQRYQLIRRLGEGGMGQVWLAEQTAPVRRPVALKLIKAGMYDETVVQRFQAERQSLAIMDHPAIAKVFDAGATPQGQPYFVMEYVPGLPITEYCDQKKLEIRERLELFIQACEGVQHAHQKAIIHRDLKPANILVVEVDGKPVPRIIDFGLAKATTRETADQTLFTRFGQFMGTPGYMSPEQVDPNVQDIDTRTDVYSLGVVLYVLLTGLQPFESKRRQRPSLDEWLRQLREQEPPTPSAKLSTDREISIETSAARNTEPQQLVSQLRGDLDWITMKALERKREHRYGTPSDLAADLRRHLNDEPVTARPASTGYRIRKYVRRHRAATAVVAGLVLLLGAFSVLQTLQLQRITRERDRATRITDFMTGMFKVSDPSEARGNSVTAGEILDKASTDIDKGLAQDPEVQSQMQQVMAHTYLNLGLYARAHELAQRSFDARVNLHGPDDLGALESMTQLGWILDREGRSAEAERVESQALAIERRVLGPEDPLTLESMADMGVILSHQGHFDEQVRMHQELIRIATRKLGADNALTLRVMNYVASGLQDLGRNQEAAHAFRELLEVDQRVLGSDHPLTLIAMTNLARSIFVLRRPEEAEPLFREALAGEQRVLGPEHPQTVNTMGQLSDLLAWEERFDEGETLSREALAIRSRTLGPEHPNTLMFKYNLAQMLIKEGKLRDAQQLQQETLDTQVRVLGPDHPDTLASQSQLAAILVKEGHYDLAEKIARATFAAQMKSLGPQHPDTLDTVRQLGTALAFSHRYPEASQLFRDLIEKRSSSAGQGDPWSAWYNFACVAAAAERPEEALGYLQEAVNRGYKDVHELMADEDLKTLRSSPVFQKIVAGLKQLPAAG
jgi:eukaryotic-like serine/threonine-protein kinase